VWQRRHGGFTKFGRGLAEAVLPASDGVIGVSGTNHSGGNPDACPHRRDRIAGRGPKIPGRAEQVDLHRLAARPGVPELLRVERPLGGARQLVERDAEMPAEDA
jgi:hypothetical protein